MDQDTTQTSLADAEQLPHRYDAALANQIELKWQQYWLTNSTFVVPNPSQPEFDPQKPKRYVLDMFPFPSGAGLHVGHPRGYIATDVYARYLRMSGYNVLHTMGFDAFGLPAEQYAIETGTHPRETTQKNIATILRQLNRIGLAHDPIRRIATTDIDYVKWTQWIFLQIFNSWYDQEADRAKPIAELIASFESGSRPLPREHRADARTWQQLDPSEKRRIIDSYRLAYLSEVTVNWCPALGTVLANEEVTSDGRSERGNYSVYQRPLKQWMLRITVYADRLLRDLDQLEWSESLKEMQRNWIGKSIGAEIDFAIDCSASNPSGNAGERTRHITVFTSRPDTLFGATYLVLAPEHPLVAQITTPSQKPRVDQYRAMSINKSRRERIMDTRHKTGEWTGAYAINPVNNEPLPVWVADYVLMDYGTGAIMAVPAHDERDYDFAERFGLPMRTVVAAPTMRDAIEGAAVDEYDLVMYGEEIVGGHKLATVHGAAYVADGIAINSDFLSGLTTPAAKEAIVDYLHRHGMGRRSVKYKLRDWLFSRQRYWGEPFPIVYGDDGLPIALPESVLPVPLPDLANFAPERSDDPAAAPRPPLSRVTSWIHVNLDLGQGTQTYTRESNTMPQWAGSCWYYLRYLDPHNNDAFCGAVSERYWMEPKGVDLYVGGVEHAVLHLLYARFWHKILFDLGHVSTIEPFFKLYNQGYVLAAAYKDERGIYVPAAEVEERDAAFFYHGAPVTREWGKMGKSLKNGVSPDDICREYGCDTLRLYEMSMGPLNASQPWNPRDIVGLYRFLRRVWRNVIDEKTGVPRVTDHPADENVRRLLMATIDQVRRDLDRLSFNTAIARLIELNNALTKLAAVPLAIARQFVLLLAPFAPHIAEELWQRLGAEASLAFHPFPSVEGALPTAEFVEIPVALGGKVRATVRVDRAATQAQAEETARQNQKIRQSLEGRTVRRVVYRPGKMLNFVMD